MAFKYHNWQDNRNGTRLRIGLRRFPETNGWRRPDSIKPGLVRVPSLVRNKRNECTTNYKADMDDSWDEIRHKD